MRFVVDYAAVDDSLHYHFYRAVLLCYVVCPSVLSVLPSVILVHCDHIHRDRWSEGNFTYQQGNTSPTNSYSAHQGLWRLCAIQIYVLLLTYLLHLLTYRLHFNYNLCGGGIPSPYLTLPSLTFWTSATPTSLLFSECKRNQALYFIIVMTEICRCFAAFARVFSS